MKAQQVFLLKPLARLKRDLERYNSDRLQALVGTLLTAVRIKMGIPILKAVQDTWYFNACSKSQH